MVLAEVEHLDDVRVAEPSGDARLVDEHGHEVGVLGELGEDALHRDGLLEPERAGAPRDVNLGHPTGRDATDQGVRSERRRGERRVHALGIVRELTPGRKNRL